MALASRNGFTIIELLATLVIISVLALMALPLSELAIKRAKERQLKVALTEIRSALDAYKQAYDSGKILPIAGSSGYPERLEVLVEGVEDVRFFDRRRIVFLRKIPRDPFHPSTASSASDTWGIRSYDSAPDNPREGDDVYDVYSLSTDTGLNGVPYREW